MFWHIIGFKEKLESIKEDYFDDVIIGDDTKYLVRGIETCIINLKLGITLELNKVFYIPHIKRNLVSNSTLEDEKYRVTFIEEKVLAWPKNSNIKNDHEIGSRHGCFYKINLCPPVTLLHDSSKEIKLFHRRLGNFHFWGFPSYKNGDRITQVKIKSWRDL